MKQRVIHTNSFVDDAAEVILDDARQSIERRGSFRLALSGGNTPRPIYKAFAEEGTQLAWEKVFITFGDERCVVPEDPMSNYRMAKESLFDHAPIPPENILRMRGEIDPTQSAREYESKLAELASERGESRYVHDLILLGIGEDGHTASLFPETEGLEETEKNVIANYVPKLSAYRITFTFPLINVARHVCFLISAGHGKEALVSRILDGGTRYPSGRVKPADGELTWLLGF
jgi:6-phosphogluconolactonase